MLLARALRMPCRALSSSAAPRIGLLPSAARFQEHGGARDSKRPPLTVFCGYMGATPKQMQKYLSMWHARGADTVSFAVGPQHVLMPSRGMVVMEELTAAVREDLVQNGPRPVYFHHMSVGGYLFGQWLRALERDGRGPESDPLLSCIAGQIFDSPPDMNGIAAGIGQSMGLGGLRETVVSAAVSGYLRLTAGTAGVEYEAASAAFHQNWIRAPALFYYSHADQVSRAEDVQTVAGKWEAGGTDVTLVAWEDTPHIQHYRLDPARYEGALDAFLQRVELLHAARGGGPMPPVELEASQAAAAA